MHVYNCKYIVVGLLTNTRYMRQENVRADNVRDAQRIIRERHPTARKIKAVRV